MARTLPPAKRGGGRLQHSSKAAPVVTPTGRAQTDEERAASAAGVQQGYTRAGLGTPERRAAYHTAIQAHVPRMVAWYDRNLAAGKLTGHSEGGPLKTGAGEGHSEIYQRPAPEAHG